MLDVLVRISEPINIGSDTASEVITRGGGAAANTACWMGSIGTDVTFAGRIGSDAAGEILIEDFKRNHVALSLSRTPEKNTGTVVVIVEPDGERTMFPDPGANSGLVFAELPDAKDFDALFISGYALYNPESYGAVTALVESANQAEVPIYFDLASVGTMDRFGRQRILDFLPRVQCAIMNEDEARYLAGREPLESARFYTSLVELSVIKLGSDGAIALKSGQNKVIDKVRINGKSVDVIDTTGAGDAFAAAFISSLLSGSKLIEALEAGDQLARQCVGIVGARPR